MLVQPKLIYLAQNPSYLAPMLSHVTCGGSHQISLQTPAWGPDEAKIRMKDFNSIPSPLMITINPERTILKIQHLATYLL